VVALVAEARLTKEAQAGALELLGPGGLAIIVTWADEIRGERPETASWHYTNIPAGARRYDPDRDCRNNECVVGRVERFRASLVSPHSSRSDRVEALKFLVHLIADLHQPLHCINNQDRGGNEVLVTFLGQSTRPHSDRPWNLHAVWDYGLIEQTGLSDVDYASTLTRWLQHQPIRRWERGAPSDWVWEVHQAAIDHAYAIPQGNQLGDAYLHSNRPVVDALLAKAGVRLARVLNEAFRK
jgi:hypothetical protein